MTEDRLSGMLPGARSRPVLCPPVGGAPRRVVRFGGAAAALGTAGWLTLAATASAGEAAFPVDRQEELRGFLRSHCLKCHSAQADSGIRLDDLPLRFAAVEDVERWQKVLGVLNSGEMPPKEEPAAPAAAKTEFLAILSETLVVARKAIADEGRVAALRRLNRREYAVTLRSLTGCDVDVSSLPDDSGSGGYDTFGSSLFLSSDQFEQYLAVGRKAAAAAIERWQRSAEPVVAPKTVRTEVEILARRRMGGLLNGYFLGGYRKGKEWEAAGADPAKAKDFGFPDEQEAKFRIRPTSSTAPTSGSTWRCRSRTRAPGSRTTPATSTTPNRSRSRPTRFPAGISCG